MHTSFASGFTGRSGLRDYTARLEIGVEVFFVISGFLLYRPFVSAHFHTGRPVETRSFWLRRLKRIIPAYWAAFLIITYVMRADKFPHTWDAPFIYLGFGQIYFPHYAVHGLSQAWSLCTEMSFYFFLPLYAMAISRTARTVSEQLRAELAGLGVLVAVSFAYRTPLLMNNRSELLRSMPNWLPGYLDVFALGMLLAVVSSWLQATHRRPDWLWHPALPWVSWALAFAAFVAVSNIGLPWIPLATSPLGQSLGRQTLYGLFGFFMVAPAVFGHQDRGLIRRGLQLRPIALMGVVSYGIYLWHESWMQMFLAWSGYPLFTFSLPHILIPVVVLATASATLSYVLVERPVLEGRFRPLRRGLMRSPS